MMNARGRSQSRDVPTTYKKVSTTCGVGKKKERASKQPPRPRLGKSESHKDN